MPIPISTLQQLRLLDQLAPETLVQFSQAMSERSVERRAILIKPGDTSTGLGFLLEGRLQTVNFTLDGKEVGTEFIPPGDFFGELPVIDGQAPTEYVIAVMPSKVAFLDATKARNLMFSTPHGAQAVASRLAERLRLAASHKALLALPSSFQRVCAQLSSLAKQTPGRPVLVITSPPTHQEIAIMVNTSRETVTRTLQFLLSVQVVAREGPDLVVVQPETLQRAVDGKLTPTK
jgi:CRP/FNR family transcriptional regulator, cyclic AMP receptor protein